MEKIRFDGRVALITGAGKGLGRAYAHLLAERGARVVVNNRKREPEGTPGSADLVVAEILAAGGEAVADYHSVESWNAGQAMVQTALDAFGGLDIVINNAGIDQHAGLHNTPIEDFERIFAVSFYGGLYATKAALPVLRAAGYGRILFTTSSAGLYGQHGLSSYSAAKAGIIGLMRAVAQEGEGKGILSNALAPYAYTQMTEAHAQHFPDRLLGPELVAPIAAYLVSEACPVTGEIYVAGTGHFGRAQMVENRGVKLSPDAPISPEDVAARFDDIRDMADTTSFKDAIESFMATTERS